MHDSFFSAVQGLRKGFYKQDRPKILFIGRSPSIQFSEAVACWIIQVSALVSKVDSKTDSGEQGQGVADVANGELVHGLGLLF
jgi:hypothetical protein